MPITNVLAFNTISSCLRNLSKQSGARYYPNANFKDEIVFELFKLDGIIILLRQQKTQKQSESGRHILYNNALEIRLNPKRLLETNEYVKVARESDYKKICQRFKEVMRLFEKMVRKEIDINGHFFPQQLNAINHYRVKRIDYCVNIRTELSIQLIELIRRASIPPNFKLVTTYDGKSKRRKAFEQSFYIMSDSVVVNIYNKEYQMNKEFGQYEHLEDAKNIIRVEVQCLSSKTNNIKQQYGWDVKDIVHFINADLARKVIFYYYQKTIGFEDYYTLDEARQRIEITNHRKHTKMDMIEILELISQKRSIPQALEAYCSEAETPDEQYEDTVRFNRLIKKIKKCGINPVTIPANWGLEHISNLINEMDKEFMPLDDVMSILLQE